MFSFNPFKILEIDEGATPNEIKKAYRRMSLQVCRRGKDGLARRSSAVATLVCSSSVPDPALFLLAVPS
jgi:hypothetical protein